MDSRPAGQTPALAYRADDLGGGPGLWTGGSEPEKVAKFLSQDEVLVAQLADYADKTAQAEQLVSTLSNSESSSASVNAALNGFASRVRIRGADQ